MEANKDTWGGLQELNICKLFYLSVAHGVLKNKKYCPSLKVTSSNKQALVRKHSHKHIGVKITKQWGFTHLVSMCCCGFGEGFWPNPSRHLGAWQLEMLFEAFYYFTNPGQHLKMQARNGQRPVWRFQNCISTFCHWCSYVGFIRLWPVHVQFTVQRMRVRNSQ